MEGKSRRLRVGGQKIPKNSELVHKRQTRLTTTKRSAILRQIDYAELGNVEFRDYQSKAAETDVTKRPIVTLLGLIGEVGSLQSVYKKRLRDKPNDEQFKRELSEEIGDTLWYLSSIATLNGIDLEDVAASNLLKAREFFGPANAPFFDDHYPVNEQFPDHMRVEIGVGADGRAQMIYDGRALGDSLSNNSHIEDNYKFHDAYHLAFLAHLHWSPNIRRLLKRKRKSNKQIDENEDGARACAVEEGAAAMVFAHGVQNAFFQNPQSVPFKLVSFLRTMTENFEVNRCNTSAWRQAIYDGSRAFAHLSTNGSAVIEIDVRASTFDIK